VGVWMNEGLLHRLTRWAEWRFLAVADVVAVLSERRRREVEGVCRRPPYVLPCAVDTRSFHADPAAREALRLRLGLMYCTRHTGKAGPYLRTRCSTVATS
jgi:hypothetical protein